MAACAIAAILLAAGFFLPLRAESAVRTEELAVETQAGKKVAFDVEIADTPVSREVGLMFRREMAEDRGMLFQMGRPARPVSFWMKNTLIPLDIIFIGEGGRIVSIGAGVPESLSPVASGAPVVAVLEIGGGLSARLGIAPGDRVLHPYFHEVR